MSNQSPLSLSRLRGGNRQRLSVIRRASAWAAAFTVASFAGVSMAQQLNLTGTSYSQNFDSIGSGLPAGWTVRNSATATSLGSSVSLTTAATPWATTSGAFYNYAAADGIDPATSLVFTGAESATTQAAATDRALGARQTGTAVTGGDPGDAFTLQIGNTVDLSNFALSFKAQILSSQPRSTTWTVQYATGPNPTTFNTLTTFVDPNAFGSTTLNVPNSAFTSIIDPLQNLWFRIVALAAATGAGNRDTFGIDDFSLTYDRAAITLDFWDTNGATAGTGGTGIWDANSTGTPWNSNSAGTGAPISYDPTHLAVFGGTAGIVTVAGTVTTNRGLQFDTTGYQVVGGTIMLAGALPTISVTSAGATATISATLAGTAGLTKSGPGTLVLGGTNTFTGGTALNEGVISIAAESALGGPTSGVAFGGGALTITSSLALGAGRTLSGAGSINVAPGTTLQIAGDSSNFNLTLTNTGAVQFTNATPTLTGLTLQQVAAVTTIAGTLALNGNLTTHHTAGTVAVSDNINFGATPGAVRVISVDDGSSAVDLRISGNLSSAGGTNARVSKVGAGTLELAGTANALSGSLRLGESGSTATDGGTVRIASATAFGASVFQANAGNVVILTNMTGANAPAAGVGLSIGANDTLPVTFSGSDIEFKGASSLFIGGTDVYQNKLVLNNNVIISGSIAAASGAVVPQGLTISGPGSLTIANAANLFNRPITVDGATLVMAGNFTQATAGNRPAVTLQNGGALRGGGILGNITAGTTGNAAIAPGIVAGEITGVISGNTFDLRSTATLSLDIRSTATVNSVLQYDQLVANSDLFIDSTVLSGSIASGANIAVGDLFFIAINGGANATLGAFANLAENATTTFTGPGGSITFRIGYHGDSATNTFDASAATIPGNDIVLRALVAVPEPGSVVFLATGLVGLLGLARSRRTGLAARRPGAAATA